MDSELLPKRHAKKIKLVKGEAQLLAPAEAVYLKRNNHISVVKN